MRSPLALPFLAACLGIALFSGMDAVMKALTIAVGAYNAMFWRMVVGAGLAGTLFIARRESLPTRNAMRLHIRRGAIAAVMATTFFWGIARVPLAEGIALSFFAPLITLYLAAVLLGETIGRNTVLASLLGLAGVGVMVAARLGAESYDRDALLGIGSIVISAIFYAYHLILQRQQAQVATPVEVAFFQPLIVLCILSVFAPIWLEVPPTDQWPSVVGAAVLATVSLLLLSWAYARAEAQALVAIEYTAFPWAAALGWLVFSEPVTWTTIAGAALIVAGCFIAARGKPDPIEVTAV